MSLLELKKCHHCGKHTWQEFVPQAPPGCSFWRCRDCGDRRTAMRVSVGETALLNRGRLQTEHVCADVLILDISPTGARLRCDEDVPVSVRPGEQVLFNPQLQPFGELAHYIPSLVRWSKGLEFGIRFNRSLTLSASDIMRIVKN